jgi:hypothetical protein
MPVAATKSPTTTRIVGQVAPVSSKAAFPATAVLRPAAAYAQDCQIVRGTDMGEFPIVVEPVVKRYC